MEVVIMARKFSWRMFGKSLSVWRGNCGIAVNIKITKAAVLMQRDFALTIISMSLYWESQELDDRIDYEEFTLYSKIRN